MQKKLFFKCLFVVLILSLFLFPFTAQANELTGSNFIDPSEVIGDQPYRICYSDYFSGYNVLLFTDNNTTDNSNWYIVEHGACEILVQGVDIYGYDGNTWVYIRRVGNSQMLILTYSSFTDYNVGLFRTITAFNVSMFSGLFELISGNIYLFSIIIVTIACGVILSFIGFLRLLKLKRSKKYYVKKI